METKQMTRYGAYGLVSQDSRILLTLKKKGPYEGLWDLPGGGIEFGETPEEALKRELAEETALDGSQFELVTVATSNCEYTNNGVRYSFHHVGIIYKVGAAKINLHLVPEEEMVWMKLSDISLEKLTPITKQVLKPNMPTSGY